MAGARKRSLMPQEYLFLRKASNTRVAVNVVSFGGAGSEGRKAGSAGESVFLVHLTFPEWAPES